MPLSNIHELCYEFTDVSDHVIALPLLYFDSRFTKQEFQDLIAGVTDSAPKFQPLIDHLFSGQSLDGRTTRAMLGELRHLFHADPYRFDELRNGSRSALGRYLLAECESNVDLELPDEATLRQRGRSGDALIKQDRKQGLDIPPSINADPIFQEARRQGAVQLTHRILQGIRSAGETLPDLQLLDPPVWKSSAGPRELQTACFTLHQAGVDMTGCRDHEEYVPWKVAKAAVAMGLIKSLEQERKETVKATPPPEDQNEREQSETQSSTNGMAYGDDSKPEAVRKMEMIEENSRRAEHKSKGESIKRRLQEDGKL